MSNLFKPGTTQLSGIEEAILRNIRAVKEFTSITRTSLGPSGLQKIIVNHLEKVFLSADAAVVVSELELEHPAAKIVALASQQQQREHGDFTNETLLFAGALLDQAESLLKAGIHPSDIISGYEKALDYVLSQLPELCCHTVTSFNKEDLSKSISAVIQAKKYGLEDILAPLVADASLMIMPENTKRFNPDNVRCIKILGASVSASTLVKGFCLLRDVEGSIKRKDDCKVAVFSCGLDLESPENKGTVVLHNADELEAYNKDEENRIQQAVEEIARCGIDVVVSGGSVGELALHYLEHHKIMVIKVLSKFDLRRVCKAVRATPLVRFGAPVAEEIGHCHQVRLTEIGSRKVLVFRQEAEDSAVATVVIRGSSDHVMDDCERAIEDAVRTVKATAMDGRFLAGGGAVEAELSRRVFEYGEKTSGLDQYSIKKFAEALEYVPSALAVNSGHDDTYVVSLLRAAHQKGLVNHGVDIDDGIAVDMKEKGIFDHLQGKWWQLKFATGAAVTILRVDSLVMSRPAGNAPKPQNLLTDIIINYDDVPFHCHSFVVSCFSSVLKEKLFRSSSIEFPPLPFTDPDLFFLVLSTFYGQSLPVTTKSLPPLSFIASLLQFEELNDFVNERMTKGLGNFEDNSFQLDLTSLASKMITSCSRDVSVSYKNTALTMNSVLLALNSTFFYTSFTCGFADSNVRRFEYSEEFPGVSEEVFSLFLTCSIVHLSNLIFQISWIFSSYRLACTEFLLSSDNWQEEDLYYLLKISNERNQLNFLKENIESFKVIEVNDYDFVPLRVSFIVFLLPFVDSEWLCYCLMELHESEGFSSSELSSVLNALTISQTDPEVISSSFQILEPLYEDSDLGPTLVECSVEVLKSITTLENVSLCWFLELLRQVDKNQLLSKHLNDICDFFNRVICIEFLEGETDIFVSPTCLEFLSSKLPGDYCLWLAGSLVNSWKKSEEFNLSWSVDSFIKCVESIDVAADQSLVYLNILGELNNVESLESFINTYISKKFLEFWPSREKELNDLKKLVDPMKEASDHMYSVGLDFFRGNEVPQNYEKAFVLFQKAANLNHVESIFTLGSCYYLGLGVEKSYRSAAQYFKKAAELGHVFGMVNIGFCLFFTQGGFEFNRMRYQQAFNWFKKAADLNNSEGIYRLSTCYRDGTGVEKNLEESLRLLRIAVELGNCGAMKRLGAIYEKGEGIEKDRCEAFRYYNMAAEAGSSQALCRLGLMYKQGTGVDKNYQKSFDYFQKSAELNYGTGITQLINCYKMGSGTERNLDKASYWEGKMKELEGCDYFALVDVLKRRGLL
ncbi:hypothetical protein GEMRC1_007145 [Eukaryota sp. GEM-RC1]